MLLSEPVPATRNLLEVFIEVCPSLEIITTIDKAEIGVNMCVFAACLK